MRCLPNWLFTVVPKLLKWPPDDGEHLGLYMHISPASFRLSRQCATLCRFLAPAKLMVGNGRPLCLSILERIIGCPIDVNAPVSTSLLSSENSRHLLEKLSRISRVTWCAELLSPVTSAITRQFVLLRIRPVLVTVSDTSVRVTALPDLIRTTSVMASAWCRVSECVVPPGAHRDPATVVVTCLVVLREMRAPLPRHWEIALHDIFVRWVMLWTAGPSRVLLTELTVLAPVLRRRTPVGRPLSPRLIGALPECVDDPA